MHLRRRVTYLAIALGVLFLGAIAATVVVTTTTEPGPFFRLQNAVIGFLVMAIWMGYSWTLVIGGVLVFFWWIDERRAAAPPSPDGDALAILMRRYAEGEITSEEYRRMRQELERGD